MAELEAEATPLPSALPIIPHAERSSASTGPSIWMPDRKPAPRSKGRSVPGSSSGPPPASAGRRRPSRGDGGRTGPPRGKHHRQSRTAAATSQAQDPEDDERGHSPSRRRSTSMPVVPVAMPRLPSTADGRTYRGGRHYPSRVPSYEASYASATSRARSSTAPQGGQPHPPHSRSGSPPPQHRASTSIPSQPNRGTHSRAGSTQQPSATSPRRGGFLHQRGVRMPIAFVDQDLDEEDSEEIMPRMTRHGWQSDTRLDHLPMVVCHTANNDVILLEMRDMHNRKIRREVGKTGQKQARDVMYSLMNSPSAVADRKWQEGLMDVGQISRELCAEDMKVPGEDGDWETWHLNQEMYQEFKQQAPDYVEAKYESIKKKDVSKIDFEHWRMLRALGKDPPPALDRNQKARQKLKGESWAGNRGQASSVRMPAPAESLNDSAKQHKVVYGRTAVVDSGRAKPKKAKGGVKFDKLEDNDSQAAGHGLDPMDVNFTFDGGKMRLEKAGAPSPTKSGGIVRSTTVQVLRPEEAEEELSLEEEIKQQELKELLRTMSMASSSGNIATEEQLHAAALAERQFNRLQRWDLQKAGKTSQARQKGNRQSKSRPKSGAGGSRKSGGLSAKVQERLANRNKQMLVHKLTRADQTSLVNGAREREQHRQQVQDGWDKKRRMQRPGTVPVPTPEELADEELVKLHSQRALKADSKPRKAREGDADHLDEVAREAKEKAAHEAFVQEKLREFEELERAVEAHEDFVFSGSAGKISVKANQLRKLYLKVCELNSSAYDEVEASEAEDLYRQKAEAMRINEAKAETAPYDQAVLGRFKFSLEELHAARPYFKAPAPHELREKYERRPWSLQMGDQKVERPAWTIQRSIFWRRRNESDSKDCYETERFLNQQGELDWSRVTAKRRFLKLIRMADTEVADGEQNIADELDEVHQVIMRNFITIRSAFYYFCARGSSIGEACFSMRVNNWISFCREVGLTDPLSPTCNSSAINAMFVATNYEDHEAMSERELEENDDNALMRFEWLEALVRVAIAKFIQDKRVTDDVSEALELLCRYHLDTMPPEATLNPNIFRANRLYNEECDQLLKDNVRLFEAVFNCYKSKNSSKYFWMEHWFTLLENLNLVGERTGIGHTQVKLVFMGSMMGSLDELKRRQKVVSWQFLDFLEGLTRLAEALALPTKEELDHEESESASLNYQYTDMYRQWEFFNQLSPSVLRRRRRPSFGIIKKLGSSPTRSLADKMRCFIGFMVAGLCERWNVPVGNVDRLTSKLNAMSVMLGGGIELA